MDRPSEEVRQPDGRGRRTGDDALDRAEIADRQTQVAVRILAIANVAHLASITITAAVVVPPGRFRDLWALTMLGLTANSCRMWWPWILDAQRSVATSTRRVLLLDVLAGALCYAVLTIRVHPELEGPKQVVLTATLIGVIGSGAVALSTVRSITRTWIAVTLGGMAARSLISPTGATLVELTQIILYGTALIAATEYLSWSFEQRYRAERAAERGREVLSLLLDDFEGGARDWLWRTDTEGRIVTPSARFVECSGLDADELQRRRITDVVDDGEGIVRAAMDARRSFHDVVVPVTVAGAPRWWSLTGAPRPDGTWSGVGADVTDAHEHQREIRHLASTDSLTGLANRHSLMTALRAGIEGLHPGQHLRLTIIDLDNFKAVNDTLGHPTGDRLLVEVARRLRGAIPTGHTCGRLGGDEFAIVGVARFADDGRDDDVVLRSVFAEPFTIDGTRLEIKSSIGSARIPDDASDADEAVMLADLALYAAKDGGRNRSYGYEPSLRAAAEERAQLLDDLHRAIEAHGFEVHLQPLVDARGRVAAFEALARWHHPHRGHVPPDAFIALAEESGLIVPLGEQLLDAALAMASRLPPAIRIGINVSPVQLTSHGFFPMFRGALARHGVDPERLDVEVTESTALDVDAWRTVTELRAHGCGLAIDDFGTGYSSFAALQDLPITQLKIDRAFIERVAQPECRQAQAIIRAIVDVADAGGLTCVAEGVETPEQRALVLELGCHLVQGYVESPPLSPAEVIDYLERRGTSAAPR